MESNILRSPLPTPSYPSGLSLPEFFRSNLDITDRQRISRICVETGTEYTFAQVIDQDLRFANALLLGGFGLKEGDNIAIFIPSISEYFAIQMGVIDAGFVAILFNPDYTEYEIETMLDKISISAVICMPQAYERINAVFRKFHVKTFITVGANDNALPNYFDLIQKYEQKQEFGPCDEDKTAFVYFSSGTTGVPKGAAMSHKNFISHVLALRGIVPGEQGSGTVFSPWQPYSAGGVIVSFAAFDNRWANLCSPGKFSKPVLRRIVKEFKPTMMFAAASLLSIICATDGLHQENFAQLKSLIFGGGFIDEVLLNRVKSKVGPQISMYALYGASETSGVCTLAPYDPKSGTKVHAGKLVPGMEIKIIDTATAKPLGANQQGELCLRGPKIFKGYINNDKANVESLRDGWYHSGDLAYYDEDGLIFVEGRIKDIMHVHGYQVSPEEIENAIRKHELVEEALVFGVHDDKSQVAPRAWIVAKSDALKAEDIHEFLKDKLVHYKQLRGGIRFVKSLPTTPAAGKISRKAAQELDAKMVD